MSVERTSCIGPRVSGCKAFRWLLAHLASAGGRYQYSVLRTSFEVHCRTEHYSKIPQGLFVPCPCAALTFRGVYTASCCCCYCSMYYSYGMYQGVDYQGYQYAFLAFLPLSWSPVPSEALALLLDLRRFQMRASPCAIIPPYLVEQS